MKSMKIPQLNSRSVRRIELYSNVCTVLLHFLFFCGFFETLRLFALGGSDTDF